MESENVSKTNPRITPPAGNTAEVAGRPEYYGGTADAVLPQRTEFPDAGRFLSCLHDPAYLTTERRRVDPRRRYQAEQGLTGLLLWLRVGRLVRRIIRRMVDAEVGPIVAEVLALPKQLATKRGAA
jgi:hypothetical protein